MENGAGDRSVSARGLAWAAGNQRFGSRYRAAALSSFLVIRSSLAVTLEDESPLGITVIVVAWPRWTEEERPGARWGSVQIERTPAVLPVRNGCLKRSTRVPACVRPLSSRPFTTAITATTATQRNADQT